MPQNVGAIKFVTKPDLTQMWTHDFGLGVRPVAQVGFRSGGLLNQKFVKPHDAGEPVDADVSLPQVEALPEFGLQDAQKNSRQRANVTQDYVF